MRLLWLQNSSVFEGFGGIEYYLDDLLTSASDTWGPGSQEALVPQRSSRFQELPRAYRVTPVPFSSWRLLAKIQNRFSFRYFLTALRRARETRPDYLVCGHVSLGPLTALVSLCTGIPYLSCVYGIEAWGGLPARDEWALRRSAGILSISHWTKQLLTRRGIAAEKIEIIHPRLDSRFENRPFIRRQTAGPVRLLTVSRLDAAERYKGHDHVLHALHILKERSADLALHYTIQGDGSDRTRLEKLAEEWGLGAQVTFAGSVKDRLELDRQYENTDVFVMPSRFGKWERRWRGEGFGIVYLEAAAMGVPSVAYACGGVMDILENGETGVLVAPDEISALADALEKLARDPEERNRLGRAAHAMVEKRFTRPAIHREILAAFDAINTRRLGKATKSQFPQPSALTPPPL